MSGTESSHTLSRRSYAPNIRASSSASNILRFRSEQIIKQAPEPILDQEENERQLLSEIQSAKRAIQHYKESLQLQAVGEAIYRIPETQLDRLRKMEKIINRKDQQINKINEEIRILRTAPEQARREVAKKYKTFKEAQNFKLADQVAQQREELISLQQLHEKKAVLTMKRRRAMDAIFQRYEAICWEKRTKPLLYFEFSLTKLEQKRDETSRIKRTFRKQIPSLEEISEANGTSAKGNPPPINLREANSKKETIEYALQTYRKKHQNQMAELSGKLEFLKDENEELEEKLRQKSKELYAAEMRFSESSHRVAVRQKRIKMHSEPNG